jgi:transposase
MNTGIAARRCIGLDVHREFAQVAIWQAGVVRQEGRIATTPEDLRIFAQGLGAGDEVALEATGNTWAIATLLASRAARVVVSNPGKTRAIAEAKVKTDKVDAAILAQLLAADFLPAVWLPDEATNALRRQVIRRAGLVRQRTRGKNQIHAVLHRNLVPRCPASDLFGHKGRRWLAAQCLPADEQTAVAALLRQLDFHTEELLVEAAWAASKAPGPLRAFHQRVRGRRGIQIAAVATARKLTVLCWHLAVKGQDYAFAQPSLVAHKQRKLELRAGLPATRGRKGTASEYSLRAVRDAERRLAEQAEHAYRTLTTGWQPRPPAHHRPGRTAPTSAGVDAAATTGARLTRPSKGTAARQG